MKTKTDARKLDGATQAHLRKMVVQAVRDGMTQTAAAKTYGVSLRVSKWTGWRATAACGRCDLAGEAGCREVVG